MAPEHFLALHHQRARELQQVACVRTRARTFGQTPAPKRARRAVRFPFVGRRAGMLGRARAPLAQAVPCR